MKKLHGLISILIALTSIFILLITSFEVATYSDFDWYEKEYKKYDVTKDLEMEMPDVMQVTHEMMAYLRGDRGDLVVETTVDGTNREFFNDREKAHMEDVQHLFLLGLRARTIAVILLFVLIALLLVLKADWKRLIPKAYRIGLGIFAVILLGLTYLFSTDFTTYFVKFHEMFFDNDLWLLDPETDLLIRMLPEGFFSDMALRIVLIFVLSLIVLLIGSFVWSKKVKKDNK